MDWWNESPNEQFVGKCFRGFCAMVVVFTAMLIPISFFA